MLKKIIPVLSKCIKSVILVFILLAYVWLPITIKASDTVLLDKVIAIVNQEQILHSDLEAICMQLALEDKVVDASVKMGVLQKLVVNKMLLSKARLHDIEIPKEHILSMQRTCDLQIANFIRKPGSKEKLVQVTHQSIYHFKKALMQSRKEQYLVSLVCQYLTQHVEVRPEEVKAYFNALPTHSRPYYPASVEVHQLVVYPKVDPVRQEAIKSKLLHLKQLLLDGVSTIRSVSTMV